MTITVFGISLSRPLAVTAGGLVMATTSSLAAFAAGEADAQGGFPPFDSSTFASQLLWLALTFGLFYYLMAKIALPRISGILEVRSDRIAQDIDEAARLTDESDAAQAAYEQELAEARSNAHRIAQDARDAAKAELDSKRTGIEARLGEKIAEAERQIAETRETAMGEVGTIAEEITATIVAELLGKRVTDSEAAGAVASVRG